MQKILVFPRHLIHGIDGFVPWAESECLINSAGKAAVWMARSAAERSNTWVQPIPCAIFHDHVGRYCVFRQIRQSRQDLSGRLSFIVGGHIDQGQSADDLDQSLCTTIKREIWEEIGLLVDDVEKPVGIVVDNSSLVASRHIGIVFDIEATAELRSKPGDEFSVRSKFNGKFLNIMERWQFHGEFDPWSSIISAQYMEVGDSTDIGHQAALPMLSTE